MTHPRSKPFHGRRIARGARAILIATLWAIGSAQAASADVVYSYTGPAFDAFVGAYACAPICRITGSIGLPAALPANRPVSPLAPTSYRFTDGNQVFDPTTVQQVVAFQIGTDATGRPSTWDLTFKTNTSAAVLPARALSTSHGGFERDITTQDAIQFVQPGGNASCSNCVPGTWSAATTVGVLPQPGALWLLAAGLIAIGSAKARKRAA